MIWSSIEDMEKGIYDDVEEICEAVHYRLSRKGPSINDVSNFFSNTDLDPSPSPLFYNYASLVSLTLFSLGIVTQYIITVMKNFPP